MKKLIVSAFLWPIFALANPADEQAIHELLTTYMQAMAAGDADTVANTTYIPPQIRAKYTTDEEARETVRKFLAVIEGEGGAFTEDFSVDHIEYNADASQATVRGTAHTRDGKPTSVTWQVFKVESGWLQSGIKPTITL